MTDEQIRAWGLALKLVGLDPVEVAETLRQLDEAMRILVEVAEQACNMTLTGFAESLEELEKRGAFDHEQTTRKKKRERDRRMVAKRSNAASFRQYKAKEAAWRTQKRTGARRREYRGQDIVR